MRTLAIGLAALSLTAISGVALAQSSTTIVTEPPPAVRPMGPDIVVDPAPSDDSLATGSVRQTPPGCASTTTRHDSPDGSTTTVRKERCNPD